MNYSGLYGATHSRMRMLVIRAFGALAIANAATDKCLVEICKREPFRLMRLPPVAP